jgi:hypothetical protein
MRRCLGIISLICCLYIQSCNNQHSGYQKYDKAKSVAKYTSKADSLDSLINIERIEANRKFNITDSQALVFLRNVKEIKVVIDWKYKDDSTIVYELIVDGIPNEKYPNWRVNIRQYQPKIQQSSSIMYLFVNANDGTINIWDISKDEIMSLDTWKEVIRNK